MSKIVSKIVVKIVSNTVIKIVSKIVVNIVSILSTLYYYFLSKTIAAY